MKKEIKKIIVSTTEGIRETILSIPSFFLVKKMYPDAELIALAKRESYQIIKNLPYIDRYFVLDDYKKTEIEEKVSYFNADVFLALYSDSQIEKIAKASKAKVKIGPITSISSFFTYPKGSVQKRDKALKNEGCYNLDLVKKLDKNKYRDNFEVNQNIYLSNSSKVVADTFFKEKGILGNTLIIGPFNSGKGKNLKDEEYINLIKKLKGKDKDRRIVLLCGIEEEERVERIIDEVKMHGIYAFPNGGEILNAAAIINKGHVYFGPLSGITHLAGAMKKRVIALYSKESKMGVDRWGLLKDEKVTYIIPDEKNVREDYKVNNFTSYNEETEDYILSEIDTVLKHYIK